MPDVPDRKKYERSFRWRLVGAVVCWSVIAVANLQINEELLRWDPDIIAAFALASAACTLVLVIRPATEFAFRYGGTLAVCTLLLRCVSLIEGELRGGNTDYFWVAAVQATITAMLGLLYANWWLVEVKDWHRVHRLVGR